MEVSMMKTQISRAKKCQKSIIISPRRSVYNLATWRR
jgi:hypothetical protein